MSDGKAGVSGGDRWVDLGEPEDVARAIRKLEALAAAPSEVAARRRALDLLSPRPGEVIVDVGAGPGTISIDIARRVTPGGRVFAVDPSQGLLAQARQRAAEAGVGHLLDCRVADGRAMPFGPAAFDGAFCHWVLLHIAEPTKLISEMRRVTRRGGRLVCVEVDWETATVHPAEPALTRRILNHNVDRNHDAWSGRKLAGWVRTAGLTDVTVEPMVNVDEGGANRAWLDFLLERAVNAVAAGVITVEEGRTWTAPLEAAHTGGTFFFSVTQFAVRARVPG